MKRQGMEKTYEKHSSARYLLSVIAMFLLAPAFLYAVPDPYQPPDSGYGSWGTFTMAKDSIANPRIAFKKVYFFHPQEKKSTVPVIFYCHGINAETPTDYFAHILFLVSKGYAVIHAAYESKIAFLKPTAIYDQLWDGFCAGVEEWKGQIDTTRLGIIGHSYGGGAVPYIGWQSFHEKQWGSEGAFLQIMAPWYSHKISQWQLEDFPKHVKLVMEIFNDDVVNDFRMAIDIFNNIDIDKDEKTFITLYSDTADSNFKLHADHDTPMGIFPHGPQVNNLDYYGIYRISEALADYAFTGNEEAKKIALGKGNPDQAFMGVKPDGSPVKTLAATDNPQVLYPQVRFSNFWTHYMNPRAIQDSDGEHKEVTIRNYIKNPFYKKMMQAEKVEQNPFDTADHTPTLDPACVVPQPDSGFGSPGPYPVIERFFPHPGQGDANIHLILPVKPQNKCPVVLFAPALWKPSPDFYKGLIGHLAGKGNAVVFATYNYSSFLNQKKRYRILQEGFAAGLELIAHIVDTSRVCFIGHSYGGGTVPYTAYNYLVHKKWGQNGAALFIASPWYMEVISDEQLKSIPSHAKLVVQTFAGNRRIDWRIAEDIFYSMPISPEEKDYLVISDAVSDHCEIDADHDALQSEDPDETNVIDYYGIYRILDALMAYAFTGSNDGKKVALGNGSKSQTYCGTWPDETAVKPFISVTDRPQCPYSSGIFLFGWDGIFNPRKDFFKPAQ